MKQILFSYRSGYKNQSRNDHVIRADNDWQTVTSFAYFAFTILRSFAISPILCVVIYLVTLLQVTENVVPVIR